MVSDFFLTLRRHNLRRSEEDDDNFTTPHLNWSVLQERGGPSPNRLRHHHHHHQDSNSNWSRSIFQTTNDIIIAEMTIQDDTFNGDIPLVVGEETNSGGSGGGESAGSGDSLQGHRYHYQRRRTNTISSNATTAATVNMNAAAASDYHYPPFSPFSASGMTEEQGVWANPEVEERRPVLRKSIVSSTWMSGARSPDGRQRAYLVAETVRPYHTPHLSYLIFGTQCSLLDIRNIGE
ncbi:hypothetical protein Clacol_009458 [Clathrus columnatus]|uniref:Uncharacterized protein n=1 Tax=Clathrus columnatus TaxID=1419009 RepID=A0AAV5AKJ5_9AGAM|nr:hypothetical protein Clacol_009458 [Clathrus columnatus]